MLWSIGASTWLASVLYLPSSSTLHADYNYSSYATCQVMREVQSEHRTERIGEAVFYMHIGSPREFRCTQRLHCVVESR